MITYLEKLKDPRWQKKRLKILERDGWTCKYCGSTHKTLHVHHLFYTKNPDPWEIDPGFLLTLCEDCHSNDKDEDEDLSPVESCLGEIATLLESIWKSGYNIPDILEIAYAISKTNKPKTRDLIYFSVLPEWSK